MKHTCFLRSNLRSAACRPLSGILAVFLLVLSSVTVSQKSQAQCLDMRDAEERTNAGLEFLLCFQDNDASNDREPEVYQEVYVASTGQAATVEITSLAEPGFKETILLAPNQSKTYRFEQSRGFMMVSTIESEQVIKVKANAPIVCYGLNHKRYSADAFMAMPRNSAGTEFRVMAYRNSRRQPTFKRPSQFALAAFEDNTTVTIIPSARTINGKPAGQPFQVVLRAGEGLQVQAKPDTNELDLTGSIVRSDKPITLYGGHSRSEIPSDSGTSSDHLAETIPPVHTWGKRFVIADYPFPGTTQSDLIRVLALNNDTRVSINGSEWTTLQADQSRDTTYKGFLTIEATGPVLVATFAHTTGDGISTQLGDPFMIIAPPIEQTYTDYTFFNSDDPIYLQHFALIVTETSAKNSITLDGEPVPAIAFRDLPPFSDGRRFSIARAGVSKGFHRLKSSSFMENGMVVMAYGMGFIDSYGYTAASLFRPTNSIRAVNSHHSSPSLTERKNELEIRNITEQTIFLDSSKVEIYGDAATKYSVRLRENVAFDISELGIREAVKLHFDVQPPLEEPISGVVKIATHTPKWMGIDWSHAELTLYPQSQASVEADARGNGVELKHDHSGRNLTISVSTERASTSVKLYDALGRRLGTIADNVSVTGHQDFVLQKDQLPNGYYFVEVTMDHSPSIRRGFSVVR